MDVLVPILGESVVEAIVSKCIKKQGEFVEIDEPIVELETDKVTLEVPAAISGILDSLVVSEGDTVEVGALLATIVAEEKLENKKLSDVPFTGKIIGKKNGLMKNGKREGTWVNYDDNGNLSSKGDYKNDKREGLWVTYHSNGELYTKGHYKNGILIND